MRVPSMSASLLLRPPRAEALLEVPLEPQHGLRMELGDTRLGEPEHRADLLHGELLVVVERDHDALALGQELDRLGDQVDALVREQRAQRVGLALLDALAALQPLLAAPEPQVLEAEEAHLADLGEQLLVVLERDPE